MDLSLVRSSRRPDGIFSNLLSKEDHEVAMTLEHAYRVGDMWCPKIYSGTFECVRGEHQLHGMNASFETFEVMGVIGHSKLLFHWGCLNENSEGCILTGDAIAEYPPGAPHTEMITNSRIAFARFMRLQEGCDRFRLKVY